MIKKITLTVVLSITALLFNGAASAAAITLTSEGTNTFAGYDYTLGFEFTVNQNILVDSLGQWDFEDDGLEAISDIGIYDSIGNQVVGATVASGTAATLDGSYRYQDVLATLLMAGETYRILSWFDGRVMNTDNFGYSLTADPAITIAGHAIGFGAPGVLSWPGTVLLTPGGDIYGGANFKFSTVSSVPVPAAVWLFGTALIGLIGFGKRKSRITA